jgi:nitrite reductase/ring-hydroxylating ferredoxin subunit
MRTHAAGSSAMKVVVAPVDDFKPGDRRIIKVGGRSIGVFRVGDRFYGIRNRCPHQGGPLCKGRVSPWARSSGPGDFQLDGEATLLACPWHGWEYDLATGQSFLGPGEPGVKSYDVDIEPGARIAGREPGPYVAETFPVHVEEDYVVIDA